VPAAKASGASLIIVNAQPTPFDDLADATIDRSISEVLPELFG
jgi:NAD-dependent SIR2 family protein deacetylase